MASLCSSSLTVLGSEVHQSLCEVCPTVWLPFCDFWASFGSTCSGFHMNLLIPSGHMDLFAFFALWGGGSPRFSFHFLGTTLVNQAQGANWGCSLWEVVATSICSNIKGGHLPFGATWLFPISCGVLCLWDTICPLGLVQFYTLWPWGVFPGVPLCFFLSICQLFWVSFLVFVSLVVSCLLGRVTWGSFADHFLIRRGSVWTYSALSLLHFQLGLLVCSH